MPDERTFTLNPDEVELFLQEVNGHLQTMEAGILNLEQAVDPEMLNATFRAAHTLKAVAATVGHQPMAELTHAMETLFDAIREGQLSPSGEITDELLAVIDILRAMRDQVISFDSAQDRPASIDAGPWIDRLALRLRSGSLSGASSEARGGVEAALSAAEGAPRSEAERGGVEGPALTGAEGQVAEECRRQGLCLLRVHVVADLDSFAPAARLLQAARAAAEHGRIIAQHPSDEELLQDQHDGSLQLLLSTTDEAPRIEQALRDVEELVAVQVQEDKSFPPLPGLVNPAPERTAGRPVVAGPALDKTVQISVDRLDVLLDLVGEMVTDRTRLLQIEETLRAHYGREERIALLRDTVSHLGKIVDQLQEEVMQARMMPISALLDKFPRLVRDVARAAKKQVNLIVEGETTELDRSILAAINDPLIHLLRNAVDHGIELPQRRTQAGKEPTGSIWLMAEHVEGQIVITVRDDGQGIDPRHTRQAAVRRGLLSQEEALHLGDDEAIALIFQPGLSTSEQVTETSGRGVGLDVVRTNISRIGGSVVVETEPGQGTVFRITLPLTLAIMQTMLVGLGDDVYAIPMSSIAESMYLEDVQVSTIKGNQAIRWRDGILPLLPLGSFFENPYRQERSGQGRAAIIAVAWGKLQAGLVVDRLIGKQEIVVKPFGPIIGNAPGLSGCTLMGNGRIALIVDVPSLINVAIQAQKQELLR